MPNNQPPSSPSQAMPLASTTPPHKAAGNTQSMLGELIACISESISALVCGEIDLAKAEDQRMAKEMGLGARLFAAAGILALFIFRLALGVLTTEPSHVMPLWATPFAVALILIPIAVPMVLIDIKRLKVVKVDTPTPQEGLKESVNAVKGAATSGLQRGNVR